MELRDQGIYDAGDLGKLPPKMPGEHRWVVVAGYALSDTQARKMERGDDVHLDRENRVYTGTGCFDCEQSYTQARRGPCTAPAAPGWEDKTRER
jgi:hypothetical protein